MPQKRWVFDPNSDGKKIPESKKQEVTHRIEKYELSVFPDGSFVGKPEDAFAASAMYLE
ncbi:MAG TPA: hypothetical protein PLD25_31785 [Chloroflexota bacterium]|nr:hypothetical protein [Chloroflexota bacterium]HUM70220.1 hypothetical protein [Chloroflexota bacterium]